MALDLTDKTINDNTLTNNGATEVTASLPFGASTSAADLEAGDSDYLSAADSASLSITNNLTLELWAKFESLPSSGNAMYLLSKLLDPGNRSYGFYLLNNGGTYELHMFVSDDGTGGAHSEFPGVTWTPSTDTWYHLAVTYASGSVKFYVDGAQQGATQTSTLTSLFNSTATFAIGATLLGGSAGSPLDGVVDEIRVWSVVRTQTQLDDNQSLRLTGTEANLAAYWPLEALGTETVPSRVLLVGEI